MVEKEIKDWIEEQLRLGEDPEILRKTLSELDIPPKEIDSIIPKNTKKNHERKKEEPKKEEEKLIDKIMPDIPMVADEPEKPAPPMDEQKPVQKTGQQDEKKHMAHEEKQHMHHHDAHLAGNLSPEVHPLSHTQKPENKQETHKQGAEDDFLPDKPSIVVSLIVSVVLFLRSITRALKSFIFVFGSILRSKLVIAGIILAVLAYLALFVFNSYVDAYIAGVLGTQ